jgi:hypothetical protein
MVAARPERPQALLSGAPRFQRHTASISDFEPRHLDRPLASTHRASAAGREPGLDQPVDLDACEAVRVPSGKWLEFAARSPAT